jgi:hypothetical protein
MTQVAVSCTKRDEREAAGPFNGAKRSIMGLPAEGAVDMRESTLGILECNAGEVWDLQDT